LRAKQADELTANGTSVTAVPTGRTELEVGACVRGLGYNYIT